MVKSLWLKLITLLYRYCRCIGFFISIKSFEGNLKKLLEVFTAIFGILSF